MPLLAASGTDPSHLTVLARTKAAKECNRPEHDLRLLLAHVRILDILEHTSAELSDHSDDEHEAQAQVATPCQHGPEYERKRPYHPKRVSKNAEQDELADLFGHEYDGHPKAATTPTLVSIEEVEIEDWDA